MRISTAALIRDGELLFLVKRPPGGDLGDRWELPGGKVDPGETPEEALRRELHEELGIDALVEEREGSTRFIHDRAEFLLIGFRVRADLTRVTLREHAEQGFFTVDEALALDLAPSDASLLHSMKARF